MRNTLKFLLCAMCCTVILNNCVYSQDDVSQALHQSQYYCFSAEDEQLLVQELFYQLRPRFMLHDNLDEKSYTSHDNDFEFLRSLMKIGFRDVSDLAEQILEKYGDELSDVLREPYSQSTNAAKQRVLQMTQKLMLENVYKILGDVMYGSRILILYSNKE